MSEPGLELGELDRERQAADWVTDSRGRQYAKAPSGGNVYRQGEETLEQAFERHAKGPPDKPPKKSKKAQQRKPPAPTQISFQQLEHALNEALRGPAFIAAMNGDEWAAQHFTAQAPIVARNLVTCAQHNPWLHEKLIQAMTGEGILMNAMVFVSLGAAVFSYAVPPLVYYLNPAFVPERAVEMIREKYQLPERDHEVILGQWPGANGHHEEPSAAPQTPFGAPPAV